ncbi:hypothetical protein GCM10009007_12740 [Formosimonas limnophila]|uniref:Uncharacterized protein n=1 Tax=Formosimonas limnophila TaxID=1384487 RepID=A0A8J3CNK2_9BURK|nr:hypothetical protein GCM10009007_12740 [Formosimonas limnophila]
MPDESSTKAGIISFIGPNPNKEEKRADYEFIDKYRHPHQLKYHGIGHFAVEFCTSG